MSTLVDDVARQAMSAVDSNAGILQVIRWTSNRYQQAAREGTFRHLRRVAEVIVPAQIDTGTVTATRGSDLITGDAAAVAVWTPDLVGRIIRLKRNWYRISRVDITNSQLKVESEYAEADAAATSYRLVADRITLAPGIRHFGRFIMPRMSRPLTQMSFDQLNLFQPERLIVSGAGPEIVSEFNSSATGERVVEFYPYSITTEMVRYSYFADPEELESGTPVPQAIKPDDLREGVLIDIFRFAAAKAAGAGSIDLAAFYRNESRVQETKWDKIMSKMVTADRAAEDLSMLLHTRGTPTHPGDDPVIRTAGVDAFVRFSDFPRV